MVSVAVLIAANKPFTTVMVRSTVTIAFPKDSVAQLIETLASTTNI
jgi:hypothetical protein